MSTSHEPRHIKCIVVGDASVGKTRLIITMTTKSFSGPYIPDPFARHSCIVMEKGDSATVLELQDTAWQDENYYLRASHYSHADAILLCYAIKEPNSFQNVTDKWMKEIKTYYIKDPIPPLLLIGTKTDLRTGTEEVVSTEQGEELAREIGAIGFIECSAMHGMGVEELVGEILRVGGGSDAKTTVELEKEIIPSTGSCCGGKQSSSVDGDEIKVVLAGDASVGKTRLLINYVTNSFDGVYVPEPFKSFSKEVSIDGKKVRLHLQHTSWQDEEHDTRTLHYTDADLILLCYSITDHTSYNNIKTKWMKEIQEQFQLLRMETPPLFLVATKLDHRKGDGVVVSSGQGRELMVEVGALGYRECSAVTGLGVREVFEEGVRAVLEGRVRITADG